MSIDFPSASMRAAGGDLAIQVSPLGLIDISEEEFLPSKFTVPGSLGTLTIGRSIWAITGCTGKMRVNRN